MNLQWPPMFFRNVLPPKRSRIGSANPCSYPDRRSRHYYKNADPLRDRGLLTFFKSGIKRVLPITRIIVRFLHTDEEDITTSFKFQKIDEFLSDGVYGRL